ELSQASSIARRGRVPPSWRLLACLAVSSRRPSLELGYRTTCRGDLLACTAAELVRGDVDLDAELAIAENLDERVLANRSLGHQLVQPDRTAVGEQSSEVADVDDFVLGAKPVTETLELGQPHVNRHLPTFEGGGHVLTSLRTL